MQSSPSFLRRSLSALAQLGLVCAGLLSGAAQAATVVKPIYLNDASVLSRTQSISTTASASVLANSANTVTWSSATFPGPISLQNGTVTVTLYITRVGGNPNRNATVVLRTTGGTIATLGTVTNQALAGVTTTPLPYTFTFNVGTQTLAANTAFHLDVRNTTTTTGRDFTVSPSDGTGFSRIDLNVNDPLSVSTTLHTNNLAAGGGSSLSAVVAPGTVYVRSVVTDVFGASDIAPVGGTVPTLTITHASQTGLPAAVTMTEYAPALTSTSKTYEYTYTTDASHAAGTYTTTVTGYEGVEGTVTATGAATYDLRFDFLSVLKASTVISDPVNGTTNPKRIPGATIAYRLSATNGSAFHPAGGVIISDTIPANLTFVPGSLSLSTDADCATTGDNAARTDAVDSPDSGVTDTIASHSGGTVTFGSATNSIAIGASQNYCYRVTVN